MKIMGEARWPAFVVDVHLLRQCGAATVARGRAYEQQRRVSDLRTDTQGGYAATVRGSGEHSYDVELSGHLDSARGRVEPMWRSRCSCPMQGDCKHTVATLLAIRVALLGRSETPAAPPPPPAWESALAPLLGAATPEGGSALALRLSLAQRQPSAWTSGGALIMVSPARLGSRGRWIKTGATWRDIASPHGHRLPAEQRRLAHDFYRLMQVNRSAAGYHVWHDATGTIDLVGAPSSVWPVLGRAVDAGVSLIDDDDRPVVLGTQALSVGIGVERDEQGLRVRARLLGPDGADVGAGAAHLVPLGSPMHGVALVAGDALSLYPVPQSPPEAVTTLLRERGTLQVPRSDEARFTATYLPALRAASRVDAGPGYELPQVHPPRLRVLVRFDEGHRAQVNWQFVYRVDDDVRLVPLTGARADATRDHGAEQRTLARVRGLPELAAHPQLAAGPGVLNDVWLQGLQTARFGQHVLGALQAHEDVDVEIVGEVPEYGEALGAPVLQLDVVDREDDNDWFDLSLRVTVDGQTAPLGALIRALSSYETHLLLPSGTYFRLDVPALDRLRLLLEEARALTDPGAEPGSMRVSLYQAGLWEQLAAIGVVSAQSRRWAQAVDRLLAATDRADGQAVEAGGARATAQTAPAHRAGARNASAPLVLPGLEATLRPYQADGFGWLHTLWDAGLGGVLADDMGLGKTIQSLALLTRAKQRGELTDPVLVVAPTSVIATWVGEAARFAPALNVVPVTETQRRRGGALGEVAAGADVVVTSYTLLRIGAVEYRETTWSGVILDEAQFVKNYRAKTYAAVRRLERRFTLAITGTPLENSLMDLWAILSLTCPGLFPDPEAFARDYRRPIESGNDTGRLASLRRHIRPFVLRRTKDQVAADLPPKTEQVVSIPMAPAHRRAYERHLQRERQRLLGLLDDMARNRVGILAALTKLRQMALDPGLVDPEAGEGVCPAKVDALIEQLTELAREGHRALVFSQFTRFLKAAQARLEAAGIDVVYLDGSTRNRSARIEEFRGGAATAFLISLKAGGFGLTLTEADYVFVLDPWWNPAAENQAIDRAHRIGQDKPVMVYRYVSAGTIEEKVHALQRRKQGLFDRVVDDDASLAMALGADDIRELLAG